MCRAAQEAGAPHRKYIYRKKENVIFTPLYLGVKMTSNPNPNPNPNPIGTTFATELPASPGSIHSKFEGNRSSHFRDTSCQSFDFFFLVFFFFVFLHTCKNCYNTRTRAPIALKFGTQKGSSKANPSIKFGAIPMNGSGVMTDYSRKTRSICCHAYRLNRFME